MEIAKTVLDVSMLGQEPKEMKLDLDLLLMERITGFGLTLPETR